MEKLPNCLTFTWFCFDSFDTLVEFDDEEDSFESLVEPDESDESFAFFLFPSNLFEFGKEELLDSLEKLDNEDKRFEAVEGCVMFVCELIRKSCGG